MPKPKYHTIEFEAPVGQRIMKRWFIGACVEDNLLSDEDSIYWSRDLRCWNTYDRMKEIRAPSWSSWFNVYSVKAFIRHLNKHPELRHKEVRLRSRFIGHDIIAKPIKSN
jgi:hypothetical protein